MILVTNNVLIVFRYLLKLIRQYYTYFEQWEIAPWFYVGKCSIFPTEVEKVFYFDSDEWKSLVMCPT